MTLDKTIQKLKTGRKVKIAALGDSLTYGWMVGKGYLDFLKEMINEKYPSSMPDIIKRGVPGDTAGGGLHRLNSDVIKFDPDIVLVQFGLNDAFSGYSADSFKNNIISIIIHVREQTDAEVLLMTSSALEGNDWLMVEKFYTALKEISEEESVPIALVHEYWEQKISEGTDYQSLVQSDMVHPTELGYCLMAEAVAKIL